MEWREGGGKRKGHRKRREKRRRKQVHQDVSYHTPVVQTVLHIFPLCSETTCTQCSLIGSQPGRLGAMQGGRELAREAGSHAGRSGASQRGWEPCREVGSHAGKLGASQGRRELARGGRESARGGREPAREAGNHGEQMEPTM